MCGLAGIFSLRGTLPKASAAAVRAALAALRHRGPDAENLFSDGMACLGHRRLSVLDIAGGGQPFSSDQSVLVYNGELYGFGPLRAELHRDAPLHTRSDCEVLLRVLERSGVNGLDSINGMYAFAWYDLHEPRLLLAIDPVGIKPLYYSLRDGYVAFASELMALCVLLRQLGERIDQNVEGIEQFLTHGWFSAPRTAVSGVSKLLPGEAMTIVPGRAAKHLRRALPAASSQVAASSDAEWQAEFTRQMSGVIADQLVADVPVGLMLSGGLDSSLVATLAAARHSGLRTFCVSFPEASSRAGYDESAFARDVANAFGTCHEEVPLESRRVASELTVILDAIDEPIADPAVIPLYFVAELAAAHVKVCLTGDGGDEIFGGYVHHRLRRLKALTSAVPRAIREPLLSGVAALRWRSRAPQRWLAAVDSVLDDRLVRGPFSGAYRRLLPDRWRTNALNRAARPLWGDADALLVAEIEGPLAGAMLPKTDRITMRLGLEARVPFLDDRIVAFGRALPWRMKVRGGQTKYIVRQVLAARLPARITQRGKRGLRVPLNDWLRADLREFVNDRLGGSSPVGEIVGDALPARLLREHGQSNVGHGERIWALLVLDHWLRRCRSLL